FYQVRGGPQLPDHNTVQRYNNQENAKNCSKSSISTGLLKRENSLKERTMANVDHTNMGKITTNTGCLADSQQSPTAGENLHQNGKKYILMKEIWPIQSLLPRRPQYLLGNFANNQIYCDGPILRTVQDSFMFPDSKHFVDMSLKFDPIATLRNFDELGDKAKDI
ncbi:hypothetical protein OSTOST_04681, partial [Ostertagia ostertagi]